MSHDPKNHLTALLEATRTGQAGANDRLTRTIYGELRRIARGLMRHERTDRTLQPSALVREALLRLLSGEALARLSDCGQLYAAPALKCDPAARAALLYVMAFVCALLSPLLTVAPDVGPLIFGVAFAVGLSVPGWKYSRHGRDPEAA